MKNLCVTALTLASCSVYASSTIHLAMPNNQMITAHSEANIPLDSLPTDVPYMITCQMNATSPTTQDVKLSRQLAPNGGFGVTKLNNKPFHEVGTLQAGDNTFSFMVSISSDKTKTNQLTIKNLDDRFSASITSCQAQPVSNVTSAANQLSGGYFYVTNHLPYFVDIGVGNFIQTTYCLYPYSKQYVETSTSYQDIDIIATHY